MTDTANEATVAEDYWRIVQRVTGPLQPHDTKESWRAKAARIFGVKERRIRALSEGRVERTGAVEFENAKRIDEEHRRREIARLEQQVAVAYARCQDDKNAFIETLVEIVGPRHPLVSKFASIGERRAGASVQEDGEA
ncbi:MAG: hypothetical protein ACR2RF_26180 [Geminicoccaceae bacterium]